MSSPGYFIVVEGLEGAGKSTAIQTIKTYLETFVPKVIVTREPGGTHVGEVVRTLIKEHRPDEPIADRSELLLFYAARTQLVEQVIRPALAAGTWVIADRFELSTFAYQGGGRGVDLEQIAQLSQIALHGFKPDLVLFLDIDPAEGLRRVVSRGERDRIEQESLAFFNAVNRTYHQMIDGMDNVRVINAGQTLETVQESILHQLQQFRLSHAGS